MGVVWVGAVRRVRARKGGGTEGLNPDKVGAEGWGPERWGPNCGPRRVGLEGRAPKGGAQRERGGPRVEGPKFRAFFPLSPPPFSLFLSLSGRLLVEFWWCLKRQDPQTPPKTREDTQRGKKRSKWWRREGKKKTKFWPEGGPAEGVLNVTSESVISFFDLLSYMTTPALVVLPVVVSLLH